MPTYVENTTGLKVDAATAAFGDGSPRPGYRKILTSGERVSFDIMCRDSSASPAATYTQDAAPVGIAPFVSPAEARQHEIMADVHRTAEARRIIRDACVCEAVARTMADRRSGATPAVVAALRDARTAGPVMAPQIAQRDAAAPADNAHVVSALRAARYR